MKRGLPMNKQYKERIIEELALIVQKDFSSYFLIQKKMTDEARRKCPELLGWGDGSEAVGPARGSVGGSLVAYCLGLTDLDPLKHDLLFSRFLSPARGGRSMKFKFSSDPISQLVDIVQANECPF
jgi:DNA polymerase-3 subunit alpha